MRSRSSVERDVVGEDLAAVERELRVPDRIVVLPSAERLPNGYSRPHSRVSLNRTVCRRSRSSARCRTGWGTSTPRGPHLESRRRKHAPRVRRRPVTIAVTCRNRRIAPPFRPRISALGVLSLERQETLRSKDGSGWALVAPRTSNPVGSGNVSGGFDSYASPLPFHRSPGNRSEKAADEQPLHRKP